MIQEDVSGTLATRNDQIICVMGDHAKAAVDVGVAGTLTAHDSKGGGVHRG